MRSPVRFAVLFALGFAALLAAFEAVRTTPIETWLIEDLVLVPSVLLINTVAPQEHVRTHDRALESPYARLRVVRGCEGIETMLLLVAAVFAYPATLRRRGRGLLIGVALAWALSVARLVFLYGTLRVSPDLFAVTHGLIAPLAPLALIGLYFLAWSAPAPPTQRAERVA